jgi:hypothetical protein
MAKTIVQTRDIGDGEVKRQDLNVSEIGSAVTRKVIAGEGIVITQTGVDDGTGDVTIRLKDTRSLHFSISGLEGGDFFELEGGIITSDSASMFDKTYYLKKLFLSTARNRNTANLVRIRAYSVPDSNINDISTGDANNWNVASTETGVTKFLGGGKNLIWIAPDQTKQVVPNRRYGFYLESGQTLEDSILELFFEEVVS